MNENILGWLALFCIGLLAGTLLLAFLDWLRDVIRDVRWWIRNRKR